MLPSEHVEPLPLHTAALPQSAPPEQVTVQRHELEQSILPLQLDDPVQLTSMGPLPLVMVFEHELSPLQPMMHPAAWVQSSPAQDSSPQANRQVCPDGHTVFEQSPSLQLMKHSALPLQLALPPLAMALLHMAGSQASAGGASGGTALSGVVIGLSGVGAASSGVPSPPVTSGALKLHARSAENSSATNPGEWRSMKAA